MEFKDYYKILGVEHDADIKVIKIAYRKLARKYHPDVSGHAEAEAKFKEVAEAYEVLKDKDRRAEYDELLRYRSSGQNFEPPPNSRSGHAFYQGDGGDDFSEFFSSIFGGTGQYQAQPQYQRGQDIQMELPVFLEETQKDTTKTVSYELPHIDSKYQNTTKKKTLKVKIPAGVSDNDRIRLKGQGKQGLGDGVSGDLFVHIRVVPHPLFDVEGHNLILTLPIAPWEAVLGTKITVPTLQGKIKLEIPPNSQTGKRLRIKGKGLVGKVNSGDLFVVLKVVIPETKDEAIKQLWKQLSTTAEFDPRAEWSDLK